jgi:hypothetical protein
MSTGDDTGAPSASAPPATDAQQALAASTIPADYGSGIGAPPSSAMAQALLQNEEDIPLKTPFAALGKLGALYGAQKAGQAYNDQMYQRQVAPYRELASALSGLPTDNPAAYRRAAGQRMLGIGAKYGIPDLINQGLQYETAPQTEWDWKTDAAGNPFGIDKYNPNHVISMDDSGQLVEKMRGQPVGNSPAGALGGAGAPNGAPSAQGAPAGDPYAKVRPPANEKPDEYTKAVNEAIKRGVPPDQIPGRQQYMESLGRAGAAQQNVTLDPQRKAGDVLTEAATKRYQGLMEGTEQAKTRLQQIHLMQGALDRIVQNGGTTGMGADDIRKLQSAVNVGANALGLDQPFDITDKDFLASGARQIAAASAKGAFGARVTNFELDNLIKVNPGLETSPTYGKRMLGINEQLAQREYDLGNELSYAVEDAASKGKVMDLPALHNVVKDYDDKHHIMDPISGQDLTANPALPEFNKSGGKTGAAGAAPPPAPGAPSGDFLGILPK